MLHSHYQRVLPFKPIEIIITIPHLAIFHEFGHRFGTQNLKGSKQRGRGLQLPGLSINNGNIKWDSNGLKIGRLDVAQCGFMELNGTWFHGISWTMMDFNGSLTTNNRDSLGIWLGLFMEYWNWISWNWIRFHTTSMKCKGSVMGSNHQPCGCHVGFKFEWFFHHEGISGKCEESWRNFVLFMHQWC